MAYFTPEQDRQLEQPLSAENLGATMDVLASYLRGQLPGELVINRETREEDGVKLEVVTIEENGEVQGCLAVSILAVKDFHKIGAEANAVEIEDKDEEWFIAQIPLVIDSIEVGDGPGRKDKLIAMGELFKSKLLETADVYEPIICVEGNMVMISGALVEPVKRYNGKYLVIELVRMLNFLGEEGGFNQMIKECRVELGFSNQEEMLD